MSQKQILIVDDEETILTMLQQILAPLGYEVRVTTSGFEALFMLAQDNYQLLIADINMPRMDGIDLTRRALKNHPDLAIILTTAASNCKRAYQAYELGATGYLLKPFDTNEIRIYIANTLRLQELEQANKARLIQLESEVQTSENRLQKVIGQLQVILFAFDCDGIITISEGKGLEDLGLQPGQVVNQSVMELYGHLPNMKQAIQRALSGETFSIQIQIDSRLYESHFSPLQDPDTKSNGSICIAIDITDANRLWNEIAKKNQLASLGELAAGIAHEINNPNALILLNSRELLNIYADIAPILEASFQSSGDFNLGALSYSKIGNEPPRLLEGILDSAQRIKNIVSDLQTFSNEDRQSEPDFVDLNLVVKSALPFVDQLINTSTEHFLISFSAEPLMVKGTSRQLQQVVINLLQNACQSLANRSASISLSLGHNVENCRQVITIVDEGCGISEENMARIKEPFFTTRRNNGGTGLGLSVSTRITEECSGKLEFRSVLGEGTTTILSFPTCKEGSET